MDEYINIHTHIKDEIKFSTSIVNAKMFSPLNDGFNYSIGWHPWELMTVDQSKVEKWLNESAQLTNVLAIGEMGLDRAIETSIELQKQVFINLHNIADKVNKPIIIHCVRAYSDFLELHKQLKPNVNWIFHGFNGNMQIASELVKRGCYLSFGTRLLKSTKLQQVCGALPLNNLFFETDESNIKIEVLYEKAANLHHICTCEMQEIIHQNFKTIFGEKWNRIG